MNLAILCAVSALAIAGCNRSEASPAPTTSASAAASPEAPPAASAASAAPVSAKAKINGKSLNEASMSDIGDALAKEGYKYKSGGGMAMGANETVTVRGTKGKDEVKVSLIRPTGKADEGSMKMSSAADQEKGFAAKGATYLEKDANVLVAVVIEGKPEDAKKVLDAIIEK
jgi:hypothetical protein